MRIYSVDKGKVCFDGLKKSYVMMGKRLEIKPKKEMNNKCQTSKKKTS